MCPWEPDRMHSVLVVDDDPSMRDILSLWVRSLGYEARQSDCAEDALEHLAANPADIAVCDVHMPGENGVWLAAQIRDRFPATAIVMATSGREVEIAIDSLRNDVVDYLLKPFDRARLNEALALGLEWHRASLGAEALHHVLQDRLRSRRATVAGALAEAQASPHDAVHGLMDMLQLHLRDARGHATRVARLAVSLADELNVDDDVVEALEHGSLMHDIGKLDMPSTILSKPAPLTEAEWQVMRTHPQVGYDLVKRLPGMAMAAEIVLAHHEAFDGTGYPKGLKRDEIPLGARILTVADSFDSMTHPHTQRPSMPSALAVWEIERCSGSQFDPGVAAALGPVLAGAAGEPQPS
jgi:response regulator RpfG family c-di-GMP phosphodiesterase